MIQKTGLSQQQQKKKDETKEAGSAVEAEKIKSKGTVNRNTPE